MMFLFNRVMCSLFLFIRLYYFLLDFVTHFVTDKNTVNRADHWPVDCSLSYCQCDIICFHFQVHCEIQWAVRRETERDVSWFLVVVCFLFFFNRVDVWVSEVFLEHSLWPQTPSDCFHCRSQIYRHQKKLKLCFCFTRQKLLTRPIKLGLFMSCYSLGPSSN